MSKVHLIRLIDSPSMKGNDEHAIGLAVLERLIFNLIRIGEVQGFSFIELFDDCQVRCWKHKSGTDFDSIMLSEIPASAYPMLLEQIQKQFCEVGSHFDINCESNGEEQHAIAFVCKFDEEDVFWKCTFQSNDDNTMILLGKAYIYFGPTDQPALVARNASGSN